HGQRPLRPARPMPGPPLDRSSRRVPVPAHVRTGRHRGAQPAGRAAVVRKHVLRGARAERPNHYQPHQLRKEPLSLRRERRLTDPMAPPKPTAAPTPTAPTISPRQLMELYVREKFEELSERFLEVLRYFHNTTLPTLDKTQQYYVDAFVKVFLHLFTQTDFRPPDQHVEP